MSGLLTKEFFYIKKQWKTLLPSVAIIIVLFVTTNTGKSPETGVSMVAFFLTMMAVILTVNTMAFDETAKWDGYVKSLPVSTYQIVGAKYLFSVILSLAGVALGVLFELAIVQGRADMLEFAMICAGAGAVPLILCSILLPLFYKFGLQKARIAMMVVFVLPMLSLPLLKNTGFSMTDAQLMLLLKLSPVIVLVIVFASFFLSCKIYRNKEI